MDPIKWCFALVTSYSKSPPLPSFFPPQKNPWWLFCIQDEDYFLIEMARQTLPFMKQVQDGPDFVDLNKPSNMILHCQVLTWDTNYVEIREKLVGCSWFVKDVKVGLRSFFRKVQKLVRHRAPMRTAKVGIYNPLMLEGGVLG